MGTETIDTLRAELDQTKATLELRTRTMRDINEAYVSEQTRREQLQTSCDELRTRAEQAEREKDEWRGRAVRYWETLCDVVSACDGLVPEHAPRAAEYAARVVADRDTARAQLRAMREAVEYEVFYSSDPHTREKLRTALAATTEVG